MADHIWASQVCLDDKCAGLPTRPADGNSGRPSERGGDGIPQRVLGSDQPQSSCTTTPILHRRTRCARREWTQRESPFPAWSNSPMTHSNCAGRDVAWAAAVFPSNPPGRRWGTANVSLLCGHDSVSPRTAQGTCPFVPEGKKTT